MHSAHRRRRALRRAGALVATFLAASASHAQQVPAGLRALPDFASHTDRVVSVDVTANDYHDPWGNAGLVVTVLGTRRGLAATVLPGSPSYVEVTAPPDFFGTEVVSYRVCEPAEGGRCDESTLTVQFDALQLTSVGYGNRGSAEGYFWREPASPMTAEFGLTPRAPLHYVQQEIGVDITPETPWDTNRQGTFTVFGEVPASGADAAEWRIYAGHGTYEYHLYVGVDDDGDGEPDEEETRCVSAARSRATAAGPCIVPVVHPGGRELRYWVMAHNYPYQFTTVHFEHAAVAMIDAPDDDASIGGAGIFSEPMEGLAEFTVNWDDPSLRDGVARLAFVGARPRPGADFDWIPLPIYGTFGGPRLLESGQPVTLDLTGRTNSYASVHRELFIDVPAGATRLDVTMQSAAEVDLYLTRRESLDDKPAIEYGPDPADPGWGDEIVASAVGPGGDATLVVEGDALVPGRWYVTPWSRVPYVDATVTLEATITAVAPVVRPGSYFNAKRPGHGLLIYPAADQLAGLWYTYRDGAPTWYYLQGTRPGPDGIWEAGLYRASRGFASRELMRVGRVTATPTAPDAFTFTYLLDGATWSEPMAALGRGCPMLDGGVVDASSHWFNPATDGTGHSVQLWPDYEFYASFVYDDRGLPRFLTAESPRFAGATATLPVDQLSGFDPHYDHNPVERRTVGTMTRTFAGGTLSSISLQATYVRGVPGGWNQSDMLQPLGGPGTTQGCAP